MVLVVTVPVPSMGMLTISEGNIMGAGITAQPCTPTQYMER